MFHMHENGWYFAIIGDIKNSRKIQDRKSVQDKLNYVLAMVNQRYASSIAAKFMITLGDEFQGLLEQGEYIVDIIEMIQMEMYPVQVRFGIGVGEITTDINAEMAIGADGPGFYMAREAIEELKRNEQKSKKHASDIAIGVNQCEQQKRDLMNTVFSLLSVIKGAWTDRQREIIWEYEKSHSSQAECAERLLIGQSSVQRSLAGSNYYAYREAKETLRKVLKEIGEKDV